MSLIMTILKLEHSVLKCGKIVKKKSAKKCNFDETMPLFASKATINVSFYFKTYFWVFVEFLGIVFDDFSKRYTAKL